MRFSPHKAISRQAPSGFSQTPAAVGAWALGIKNGLHYRRDATMREDYDQVCMGQAPHVLAILNNTAWRLLARGGATNLAEAIRNFGYQFNKALHASVS